MTSAMHEKASGIDEKMTPVSRVHREAALASEVSSGAALPSGRSREAAPALDVPRGPALASAVSEEAASPLEMPTGLALLVGRPRGPAPASRVLIGTGAGHHGT